MSGSTCISLDSSVVDLGAVVLVLVLVVGRCRNTWSGVRSDERDTRYFTGIITRRKRGTTYPVRG